MKKLTLIVVLVIVVFVAAVEPVAVGGGWPWKETEDLVDMGEKTADSLNKADGFIQKVSTWTLRRWPCNTQFAQYEKGNYSYWQIAPRCK